jgi:hypothetical protein
MYNIKPKEYEKKQVERKVNYMSDYKMSISKI